MFGFKLKEGEKIIKIYRQTKLFIIFWLFGLLIAVYAPWRFLANYDLSEKFSFWLYLWLLLCFAYGSHKFTLWRLNKYILTDQRLIHLYYQNAVNKKIIETPLDRILNISFETTGIRSAIFNYGDVLVHIVGMTEPMVLKDLTAAIKIKDFLWQIHNQQVGVANRFNAETLSELDKTIGYQNEKGQNKIYEKKV